MSTTTLDYHRRIGPSGINHVWYAGDDSGAGLWTSHSLKSRFYRRGSFYIGDDAPVNIDSRLPLKLVLSSSDSRRVDFVILSSVSKDSGSEGER